jgi:hypothetical protein
MATPSTRQLRKISKDISNALIRWRAAGVSTQACRDLAVIGNELDEAVQALRDSNRVADLVCDYCKAEFRGWNEDQKYCSRRCQGKAVWEKRCQKSPEKTELNLHRDLAHN